MPARDPSLVGADRRRGHAPRRGGSFTEGSAPVDLAAADLRARYPRPGAPSWTHVDRRADREEDGRLARAAHDAPITMADHEAQTRVDLELESGYRFRADFGSDKAPVSLDEPAPLGEGRAPNASAVLAAAVGDCLSASLLFCMRRAHLDVDGMRTEVRVTPMRNPEGRLRIKSLDVVLRPEIGAENEGRFERCVDLFEDYCVVTDSVRHGIDVAVAVEPSRSAAPGEERPEHG